jgi:hypothetical protein
MCAASVMFPAIRPFFSDFAPRRANTIVQWMQRHVSGVMPFVKCVDWDATAVRLASVTKRILSGHCCYGPSLDIDSLCRDDPGAH